jgi:phage gpG-like protein
MRTNAADLEPALLRSGIVALKAAAQRIDAGGPGWPPLVGPPHSMLHVTGRLLASLTVGGSGNVLDIGSDQVTVGTNLQYAKWLQEGTGIYGSTGQPIVPKSGKALRFQLGGAVVFARSVKGVPPRRFLFIDDAVAKAVKNVFAAHILAQAPPEDSGL